MECGSACDNKDDAVELTMYKVLLVDCVQFGPPVYRSEYITVCIYVKPELTVT